MKIRPCANEENEIGGIIEQAFFYNTISENKIGLLTGNPILLLLPKEKINSSKHDTAKTKSF